MLEIALVGAGQLGSRHLQALALLKRPARVTVVDSFDTSLATAKERFAQVPRGRVEAHFTRSFADLPAKLDAAVVATGADTRRQAIEDLLGRAEVKAALLEKVLFQRAQDYDAVGALLTKAGTRAWVNCAQRLWPFFAGLRPRTLGKSNVEITVSAADPNFGLACNAIHNLDLLGFMTGSREIRISAELDPGTVPAKRPGFVEVTGTLYAFGERGNRVVQTSHREGNAPFVFEVRGADFHALWNMAEGVMRIADAEGSWRWREQPMAPLYQSRLTHLVLAEMIEHGTSALPAYAESAALHLALLAPLLAHMGRAPGDTCPIT